MPRLLRSSLIAAALVAAHASPALAHAGRPIAPHDLWESWTFSLPVVLGVVLAIVPYAIGVAALWRRAGRGRGVTVRDALLYLAGWLVLAAALISPVHALGEALFSAHMVQHELLMVLAAPLLVLGRPGVAVLWALPRRWRRVAHTAWLQRTGRALTAPLVAFLIHFAAIWIWHAPKLYDLAVAEPSVHALQHLSFFGTALLFWWSVLRGAGEHSADGIAVISLFATTLHTAALGALLSFGDRLWYSAYLATTGPWGLTPLADQQLGGLIMWMPGSLSYVVAALWILLRWIERRDRQRAARVRAAVSPAGAALLVLLVAGGAWSCDGNAVHDARMLTNGGDANYGRVAIKHYGCGSCHTIPGVDGATATVGPPLAGIAARTYIGGVLLNQPDNLMRWIQNAPGVDPMTAMPNVGVTPGDARDIAAYLYTLR